MSTSNGVGVPAETAVGLSATSPRPTGSGLSASIPDAGAPSNTWIMEQGRNHYEVDEEAGRVQFLDNRFYKAKDGTFVPSVTTILSAYPKGAAYEEWLKKHGADADEIRDEAGRRGSLVHGLTEDFDKGAEVSLMTEDMQPKYKMLEWAMFERYVDFRRRFPASIHAIELNMVSSELGYAGTLDRVFTMKHNGVTVLCDIKTSKAIQDTYWMQQAAYHELLHRTGYIAKLFPDGDVPDIKLGILHLNAATVSNGRGDAIQGIGWQLKITEEPTGDLLDMFECVRHTWLRVNKGITPKLTTYNLKHSLISKP